MIKRKNGKKKGFSLIELIIVLAVMAIIALIAIPNFTAVKKNSANKADEQSCKVIDRAVLMLVSDGTVTGLGELEVTFDANGKAVVTEKGTEDKIKGEDKVKDALGQVKVPQGKVKDTETDADAYSITIEDGQVTSKTIKVAKSE